MKDISQVLANFKRDNFNPSAAIRHGGFHVDEPTRDPDVWPPPTPVERDNRYGLLDITN